MTYEYRCRECATLFDVRASVYEKTAGLHPVCPRCGSKETIQVFGGFGILSTGGFQPGPSGCGPGMGGGCCG